MANSVVDVSYTKTIRRRPTLEEKLNETNQRVIRRI